MPKSPAATQNVALGQLIPLIVVVMPDPCGTQVEPPLTVDRIWPFDPAAKQVAVDGQLTARSGLPLGSGFCQLQLPPGVKVLGVSDRGILDRD
jgi:hypothetical protein